jgi:hypothetical protein
MIYTLKHSVQHLLVWNNAPPQIRKPPHNRRLSPATIELKNITNKTSNTDTLIICNITL